MRKTAASKLIMFCMSSALLTAQIMNASFIWAAAAPQIKAELDKDKINIADTVKYHINIVVPENIEIKIAPPAEKIGEFKILDFKRKESKGVAGAIDLYYRLMTFETGSLEIPEFKARYRVKGADAWQEVFGPALKITVESLLEPGAQDLKLKPIKPKYGLWQNFMVWLLLGVLLIAAGIWVVFLLRRRRKKEPKKIEIKPAYVIAYEELDRLMRLNLLAQGKLEEYFEILSACIRNYLENRFNLRAPWLSTEEFMLAARESALLNAEHRRLLKNFLELADLVKFARYGSSAREAEESAVAARNFIDQTKEVLAQTQARGK
ncbi:MAG: hypothetical protein KKB82_09305 [Candidatus Omnitrophica bacterium]|nr:hypothetical protein [Candidatus Omnitrophota bacterium]MBU1926101.1 hypothetical protein [Candidatus Omnitrophota bacterium]